jgi:hypothetical protein
MWVATHDLLRSAAHPFYTRLNQILDKHDVDTYAESPCHRFHAEEIGRPGLPSGRHFPLLRAASMSERSLTALKSFRLPWER